MVNKLTLRSFVRYFLTSLFFISCLQQNTTKGQEVNYSKNCILPCNSGLICYKFLYNGDDVIQIDEKRFWAYGEIYKEFAYKRVDISFDKMIKSIKAFDKKEDIKDFDYMYAFVRNCEDTIYSEYSLKRWIIKENGKPHYYEFNETRNRSEDTLRTLELSRYDKFFR